MTLDSTAADVERNSAWVLLLAEAHAVTRCASTAGDTDCEDEWLTAAEMMPEAQGKHCSSRCSLEGVNAAGSACKKKA
jgi:hypothetical protein